MTRNRISYALKALHADGFPVRVVRWDKATTGDGTPVWGYEYGDHEPKPQLTDEQRKANIARSKMNYRRKLGNKPREQYLRELKQPKANPFAWLIGESDGINPRRESKAESESSAQDA